MHVVALELLAPVEEVELDDEEGSGHDPSEALDELALGPRSASGGEHVVDDDHARARGNGVPVQPITS